MRYLKILTNVLLGRNSYVTHAIGYIDTGNSLQCRLSGRPVAVTNYSVISAIISKEEAAFVSSYIHNSASIYSGSNTLPKGMHIIPYNTICANNQLMLAVDADFMFIDDRYVEKKPLIGISPAVFQILHTDKCILLNKKYMKRGKRHVKHNTR